MIPGKSQISRRDWRPALGALLLTLPVCGLVTQTKPVQAQPQPALNVPLTFKPAPLTTDQTKALERIAAVTRYEELCKSQLDLKLSNGTIGDAIKRIKAAFPQEQFEIRQRDAHPLNISVDLKETTVGAALSGMAALADSRLWVMPDGLLISPPGQLTSAEKELVEKLYAGSWNESGEHPSNVGKDRNIAKSWTVQTGGEMLMANIIADEVKLLNKGGTLNTTFSQFSPQSQKALQQIVDWANDSSSRVEGGPRPLLLFPGSPVGISFSKPNWIDIKLTVGVSDPNTTQMFIGILLSK